MYVSSTLPNQIQSVTVYLKKKIECGLTISFSLCPGDLREYNSQSNFLFLPLFSPFLLISIWFVYFYPLAYLLAFSMLF